jgi:hypothetical protein
MTQREVERCHCSMRYRLLWDDYYSPDVLIAEIVRVADHCGP